MAFAMGLFAFVWKIVELSYLYKTTIGFGRIELWVNILGFLNQALQIVDVEDARQDRLFLFIFGGEDVVLQPHEMERRNAYLARLMNVIYEVYGEEMKRPMLAVSLMVTFNHEDLQRLVIYEDPYAKSRRIESRRTEDPDYDLSNTLKTGFRSRGSEGVRTPVPVPVPDYYFDPMF